MKINLKITTFLFTLGLCTSCGDFLEPQSQQYFVPQDVQSIDDMLLGTAYPRPTELYTDITAMLNLLDDDITFTMQPGSVYSFDLTSMRASLAIYSWQPDMFTQYREFAGSYGGYYHNLWQYHYELILGANAALDYVDKVTGSDNDKNRVKAQAYALRAFYYFSLVNIFGEPYNYNPEAPGVPLKTDSNIEGLDVPRNSVREVYEQIVSDLLDSERYFRSIPESEQYRPDYRVSLPMAQLLLSRVYLYMENWKGAAEYAGKVIHDWSFSLLDLNSLPAPVTPDASNKRTYYGIISPDSPETIWLYGKTTDYYNYVGKTFNSSQFDYSNGGPSGMYFNATKELIACFGENDLRKDFYIFREGAYQKDTIFLAYGKAIPFLPTSTLPESSSFARAFRLSEAYLNLAEAAAMDPELDDQTALDALNDLLEKRIKQGEFTPLSLSDLSGDALIERIRRERRAELCFENHRWFDLRRYGMPEITHRYRKTDALGNFTGPAVVQILTKNDPAYTLPIPEEVLAKNRGLVQNRQTSGKQPVE